VYKKETLQDDFIPFNTGLDSDSINKQTSPVNNLQEHGPDTDIVIRVFGKTIVVPKNSNNVKL